MENQVVMDAHMPTAHPPAGALCRDFPLVKSASKYFRVGIDIKEYSPFVALVKQPHKECITFTVSEFKQMTSEQMIHFNGQYSSDPIRIGTITLSLKQIGNATVLCLDKNNYRVYLAESTWKFVQRIKQIIFTYITQCETLCEKANANFYSLMTHAKYFCLPRWAGNTKIPDLNEEGWYEMLYNALNAVQTSFPEPLKQEMLCYHTDYLKETLISMM